MFGKPDWFRPKRRGWGLTPITWQGWTYTAIWCGVLAGPFVGLMVRGQILEALLWEAAAMSLLFWEVRQVLAGYRAPASSPQAAPAAASDLESDSAPAGPNEGIEFLDESPAESSGQWFSRHFHFCLRR